MQKYIDILLAHGYAPLGYGYYKDVENEFELIIRHWVTLFEKETPVKVHVWAVEKKDDDDYSKEYNTGLVEMTPEQMDVFLTVLCK